MGPELVVREQPAQIRLIRQDGTIVPQEAVDRLLGWIQKRSVTVRMGFCQLVANASALNCWVQRGDVWHVAKADEAHAWLREFYESGCKEILPLAFWTFSVPAGVPA